ncbi:hypothetical protein VitviT2T_017437 [Vitis vinifera]|uniref:Uncharacterized protein n=1 Tax=Vitis vinifera TaxID=29760 RepID=A0ABY9CW79_VITVI|nr:hypothetical protein VitviT2T_017437 [Vitis vinifera]
MEELAAELGCRVGSLPSQYLGLPLGAPNKAPYMWDGVEERVRRRLALWKRKYISKRGRITLIKSTLASMPIYQMSIFRMPKVVARRLEKVQRDFLWGGGNMEGKIHLVNWEVVCTDKDKGGLGLRKLAMLNKALLGKWIWRYACDKDNLWKQVIKVKYGQEGLGWRPKKANGAVGVGVWKEIWKESEWCWDNMIFRVGKGNTIRFWTDVWCTDTTLSHCFPHLFGMSVQRSSTIEEMWDQNSGQGDWNLNFLRDFNDWELDTVGDLLHMLRGHKPSLEEDSVLWRHGRSGQFRVKEAYSLLTNSNGTGFPSRSIWVARVPTKVAFFAWEATWGKEVLVLNFWIQSLDRPSYQTGYSLSPSGVFTFNFQQVSWAISVKESQLINNVSLDLEVGGEDALSPVRIVSPKEETTENSNENEYFDFRPSEVGKGQEEQFLTDNQASVLLNSEDIQQGNVNVGIWDKDDMIGSLQQISSYQSFLEHLDQQLSKIEGELVAVLRLSTLILENEGKPKNSKLQQTMDILESVRGIRLRITSIMQTKEAR